MLKVFISLLLLIGLSGLKPAAGKNGPPLTFFKKNCYDKAGERHGRWHFYLDAQNQKLSSKGRFKHGKEVGTWRFYDGHQQLQKVEKYRKKRQKIKTTYYYPNGKVEKTGLAKLYEDNNLLHYYWQGPWKFYDPTGEYQKTIIYEKGQEKQILN